MPTPVSRLALRFILLLAALAPMLAAADPPARVGRLSLLEGEVLFRTDRQDAGAPATPNWPISSGAILDTERRGRAEVWIGSSAFRLDGDSRVEFATVDDERIAVQVARGSLAITLRDNDQAEGIDVSTPAGQLRFGGPGRYRIDVDEQSGDTQVASRDGVAYIYRPGGELSVGDGQRGVIYAAGGWFLAEARPDPFDAWTDGRDRLSEAPTARRHVSPHMTGYEDLDRHGNWSSSPDYGTVWYPRAVPTGWAPYRYGRWAWVEPWGWTWIDEAPWGFAPFHYGRWVLIAGQWAWVPGDYLARPVYAPALVAWIGDPGWSVGFSFGSAPAVGWFPLAPREVFIPAYRSSPRYVRQVNITHVTNVTVIEQVVAGRRQPEFRHRHQPQAVTVVPARSVQSGSPIGRSGWRQPERRELERAPLAARAPDSAWLAPATVRPRQERAAAGRTEPAPRPESQSQRRSGSPGEASVAGPRQFRGQPETRTGSEPTPAETTRTMPAPPALPLGRRDGEASRPERRSDERFERPRFQAAPAPGDAASGAAEARPRRLERDPQQGPRPLVAPPAPAQAAPAPERREMRRAPAEETERRQRPQIAPAPDDAPEARPRQIWREPRPESRAAARAPAQAAPALPEPPPTVREMMRARPEAPRVEAPAPQREMRLPGRPDFERSGRERHSPGAAAAQPQPPAAPPAHSGDGREHRRERGKSPDRPQ